MKLSISRSETMQMAPLIKIRVNMLCGYKMPRTLGYSGWDFTRSIETHGHNDSQLKKNVGKGHTVGGPLAPLILYF